MKIERINKETFKPISIILETEEEARIFKTLFGWGDKEYYKTLELGVKNGYISDKEFDSFMELRNGIWQRLEAFGIKNKIKVGE